MNAVQTTTIGVRAPNQLRVAAAGLVGVAAVWPVLPAHPPLVCPLRAATGIPCPLCGMTRACVAVAHGHLATSLAFNPAGVLVVLAAVATWDVSAIRPDEVQAIRQFLDRRLSLRWPARSYFAVDLANRVAPRVVGVPPNAHPEYVLEGIVVAKLSRT